MNRRDLETLLQVVAGDATTPIYVVLTSDSPSELMHNPNARGYYSPNSDVAFSTWLQSQGRWSGRGQCIWLDDLTLLAESKELSDGDAKLSSSLFEQRMVAIGCHELAHAATNECDLSVEFTPGDAAYLQLQAAAHIRAAPPTNRPLWRQHDGRWLRATLHSCWRAEQFGFSSPLSLAVGRHYDLSSPWAYQATLVPEFDDLADVPLARLDDHPPPPEFVSLWRADVQTWVDARTISAAAWSDIAAANNIYRNN